MKLVDDLFKRYRGDLPSLVLYGFKKDEESYIYSELIHNGQFKLVLTYHADKLSGKLLDTVFEDEYSQIDNDSSLGFIASLKEECDAVLLDIRDKCFIKEVYLFDQSNRIDAWMKKNYGTTPEFMWDDTPGFGVYRNDISRKWYALIMNLSRKKIVPESENKEVEVMNLHTGNETEECLKRKGIYPCYHMNKKYWISIILDDTLKDEEIFSLIELSYQLSKKK